MSDTGPEWIAEDGVAADATRSCVELVPVTRSAQRSPKPALSRPNATFVAHLIATADQAPQTRNLRRATPADAQTAYGATRSQRPSAGVRTRQVV